MVREDSINFGLNFVIYDALINLLDGPTRHKFLVAREQRFGKFQVIAKQLEEEIEETDHVLNQAVEEYLRRIEDQLFNSLETRLLDYEASIDESA